ncbi:MAG TPA: hypothetical protein ENF18_07505, partial [candidate division WOR-3 bacterium]|nr:hypothetical protein [candidate division WOR-3 bacterium]
MVNLILITLFLISQQPAQETGSGEVTIVEAVGDGSIVQGDLAKARDDAIENALRNAVEQTVGMLLSSETITKNFMTIDDRIYSRSTGYVQRYEILNEGKKNDFIYEVKVKAYVKKGMVKDDLAAIGLLLRRKNLRRMMGLTQEKNVESASGTLSDVNIKAAEYTAMETSTSTVCSFIDKD